jgi:hypothetical protein
MFQLNCLQHIDQEAIEETIVCLYGELASEGISVVDLNLRDGCLQMTVESDTTPDPATSVNAICSSIIDVGGELIVGVKIYGQQTEAEFPEWYHEFEVGSCQPIPSH